MRHGSKRWGLLFFALFVLVLVLVLVIAGLLRLYINEIFHFCEMLIKITMLDKV